MDDERTYINAWLFYLIVSPEFQFLIQINV